MRPSTSPGPEIAKGALSTGRMTAKSTPSAQTFPEQFFLTVLPRA
ncbi:hypothetical protein [Nonomuraea dietziae]